MEEDAVTLRPLLRKWATLTLWAASAIAALSPTAKAAERYALVIANKAYVHTAPVAFADRDANAIETALTNVWGVKRRNIRRENNATSTDLRSIFGTDRYEGSLASLVGRPDGELIVYFAGHGSKVDGNPYLLGVDTRPSQLAITGYSLDLLFSRLSGFQRKHLPNGRVVVILESCFSGTSHAGELVTGTSAPAFGRPVIISEHVQDRSDKLLVMAAARGDQYAVWDTEYRQSVFTDALVSGLHGEADKARFGGDANGKITLGELESFVQERVGRRLKAVRPGTSQLPEIVGGAAEETLVEMASVEADWDEQFRRTYGEELKANMVLSNPSSEAIERYLTTCLYCPKLRDIRSARRKLRRKQIACDLEKPLSMRLLESGTREEIISFRETCRCCARIAELEARLGQLQTASLSITASNVSTDTVEDEVEPQAPQSVAPLAQELSREELVRKIQTGLKKVGCYTGRVDGQWGRGSDSALSLFGEATGNTELSEPDETTLAAVEQSGEQVCDAVNAQRRAIARKRATDRRKARERRAEQRRKDREAARRKAAKAAKAKKTRDATRRKKREKKKRTARKQTKKPQTARSKPKPKSKSGGSSCFQRCMNKRGGAAYWGVNVCSRKCS